MIIIISPAKKMRKEYELLFEPTKPIFLERAKSLARHLQTFSYGDLKTLLRCNDGIAQLNYERYAHMDFEKNLAHALLAYDGIQYTYMSPLIFDYDAFDYVSQHVRILSGLYGVLRPLDAVVPYRLEMGTALQYESFKNLYDFWGNAVYAEITKYDDCIINLASKEYSRLIESHCAENVRIITCVFGERRKSDNAIIEKGVYVKMARGEMVRFMAEHNIKRVQDMQAFCGLNFCFDKEASTADRIVFVRDIKQQ
ncbi:MAG: peroxide stress protein YaaA [Spirochaetales bacterium]